MNSHPLNGAPLNGSGEMRAAFSVSGPAVIRLQGYAPSRSWGVPASWVVQIIYRCRVGELEVPVISFQARLRDGQPTYLGVVTGARPGLLEELQVLQGEQMVVRSGVRTRSGDEITEPIVTVQFDATRYDLGPRSGSFTLTGYGLETTVFSKVVTMTGVSSRGLLATGKRTLRCDPSFFLRPGDVARIAGQPDMIVGMIALNVSARAATMDITER